MKLSRFYAPTLKETPADAEVVSHQLLLRAGYIRQLTSGIYTYLPLGLKTLNKVADVVRREMNAAGALEILMPTVQPAGLWQETGRWEFYGKELLRFVDRKGSDYCLGPTHEEVVTDLVRGEVRSYRQLPLNLYQVQTKFRDEIRPRFGLMRGREFVMKDAYSFDKDEEGANASYKSMYDAYVRIFRCLGLEFRPVQADSGSIGGSYSHEFMVLAETGEDTIATCPKCDFAANLEKAGVVCKVEPCVDECAPAAEVHTPGTHTVEEVAAFLKVDPERVVKTLLLDVDGQPVAALVRGDRELNDIKVKNHLNAADVRMASPEQVKEWTGAPVGFAGPVGLPKVDGQDIRIIADAELCGATAYVTGANKADTHLTGVSLSRDVNLEAYADLRTITPQDVCPLCENATVEFFKGIEVGHVFKLGLKYSQAMNAVFLDENGKEKTMLMGCYGIGVSRIVASAIEQNHDDNGIIFPPSMAPFEVAVLSLGKPGDAAHAKAAELYEQLNASGVEALLDDRSERPGVKFKDADLMGMPMQIIIGGKGLERGIVEAKNRKTGEKLELPVDGFVQAFADWRTQVWQAWGLEA